jgi:ADP-ribose pyrophosphatase YjhB (NUDIX family)
MTNYKRGSHCGFCGASFAEDQTYPRQCQNCGNRTYRNPTPVAVLLLPVDQGLLLVRRAIEPRKGQLAFPGGFINYGESWQTAAARELFEETGIVIEPAEVRDFRVLSAPDGTLLVFGLANKRSAAELPEFVLSEETEEIVIAEQPLELAFSLHEQVMQEFFGFDEG